MKLSAHFSQPAQVHQDTARFDRYFVEVTQDFVLNENSIRQDYGACSLTLRK